MSDFWIFIKDSGKDNYYSSTGKPICLLQMLNIIFKLCLLKWMCFNFINSQFLNKSTVFYKFSNCVYLLITWNGSSIMVSFKHINIIIKMQRYSQHFHTLRHLYTIRSSRFVILKLFFCYQITFFNNGVYFTIKLKCILEIV